MKAEFERQSVRQNFLKQCYHAFQCSLAGATVFANEADILVVKQFSQLKTLVSLKVIAKVDFIVLLRILALALGGSENHCIPFQRNESFATPSSLRLPVCFQCQNSQLIFGQQQYA
jgi:hypothetical protein